MSHISNDPLSFKFYWLNENWEATSFNRKLGEIDSQRIKLEEVEIPTAAIAHAAVRENSMVLSVVTGEVDQPPPMLIIQVPTAKIAKDIKRRLDRSRSLIWAQIQQKELFEKGQGHLYRDAKCEFCEATLILSGMSETPQLYCHFCDTLKTIDRFQEPIPNETEFRICENCQMYSKPKKFTTFYFYFLLVIYGFNSNSSYRCGGCMRSESWKMLLGNLIFILGVPHAIYQLCRAYLGDAVTGKFKGLDKGNLKAARGNVEGALVQYEAILERVPHSAGIKYNLGLALLAKGDIPHAIQVFELALEDCSNYAPAYQQLVNLYEKTGETQKLDDLNQIWGVPQDEALPEPANRLTEP